MKLEIPKIYKKLMFSEYAPEFGDASLDIWVNPPAELFGKWLNDTRKLRALIEESKGKEKDFTSQFEAITDEVFTFYAAILHEEGKPLAVEDVKKLFEAAASTDPLFPNWVVDRMVDAILEHRDTRKN